MTQDVAAFPDIAQRWAGAGRAHGEFGVITRTVGRELARRAQQQDWADVTIFAGRY